MSDDNVPQAMMTVAVLVELITNRLDDADRETVFRNCFADRAEEYKLLGAVERAAQAVGFAAANGPIEQLFGQISEMREQLMRPAAWRAKEPR